MSATVNDERLGNIPGVDHLESGAMQLVAAVQALSLARDLDTVVDIVRKAARAISRADGATFVLLDGDECHYVDEDAIGPLWKGQRFPASACVSGWAMLNRRAAVVKDISEDKRVPYEAYRATFVRSLVMVPIRTEAPIGAIGIYWAERHSASDTEVELLQALASSTSVAIENVLLYQTMEKRVEERTRQLEDLNRELETFCYSVSHDLQAPLRHITAYTELIATSKSLSIDEEGRGWFKRIQSSSAHMADLIQALLRLARYTRVELMFGEVDLSAMAREEAALLREEFPGRAVAFQVQEGMHVHGDPSLLRVVMQNLLANAWKFTARRENAHVEVGSMTQPDGSPVYFVRDDGAGFDMHYATKLFAPFQRLHSPKEFTGTGIGLATIKRIVHRHGGTIWVEASVGQGATFFFTLDAAAAAADSAASR